MAGPCTREQQGKSLAEPCRNLVSAVRGDSEDPGTLQPHLTPPIPPFTNLVGVAPEPTLETREFESHDVQLARAAGHSGNCSFFKPVTLGPHQLLSPAPVLSQLGSLPTHLSGYF